MSVVVGDEKKLAELILYISQRCAPGPKFGSVKLNKILYFADFLAFGNWGQPITAVEYQHLPNGPAPRRLIPVREDLCADGDLVMQTVRFKNGNVQKRPVNLREPNLELFLGKEIALVDRVIDDLWGLDADDASELSHRYVGWKMTKEGESIPYGSIFISDEPLSEAEILRGKELAKNLGPVSP